MRCPSCDEPGRVEPGAHREVTVGTVAGVIEGVPVVRCVRGHVEPATRQRGLAAELAERCVEAVPQARSRRLRGDACTSCGSRLTMPVRRTERGVTVDGVGALPALTLRFDVPMSRCPACGLDQVPSHSRSDLHAVIEGLTVPV